MPTELTASERFESVQRQLERWRSDVDKRTGARDQLLQVRDEEKARYDEALTRRDLHRKAQQFLMSELSSRRQEAITSIEEMASFALRGVYGPGYRLRFSITEDKTSGGERMEIQVVSMIGGEELTTGLIGERGGGVVEIVAFALRIAALSWVGYTGPLIMDEAYKSISNDDKIEAVASFLRQVADDTGRQILFATHKADVFGRVADRIIHVGKVDGEGVVTQGNPGEVLSLSLAVQEEETW